jgi:hypothetical protein
MLGETRALLEDKRQRKIFNVAVSVERREKEDPELLAKYEKTRAYRSAIAYKAAKTRKKNTEAEAQQAKQAKQAQQAEQPKQAQQLEQLEQPEQPEQPEQT